MSQNTRRTVEYEVLEQNKYYLHPDGTYHFYSYITMSPANTWAVANANASSQKWYGKSGYLATVTSGSGTNVAYENGFILSQVSAGLSGWLGGADNGVAGNDTWSWNTGPETGSQFSTGAVALSGKYANFASGEPNHDATSPQSNYLQMYSSGSTAGQWNDLSNTATLPGYFIEWGGLPEPAATVTIKIQNHNAIKHAAGF